MTLTESGITHKKTDEMLVASINFRGKFQDIPPKFEKLSQECKEYICGPPITIYDYGVYSEGGIDIEVCFPVTQNIEKDEIKTRMLESAEVLSLIHCGPYENLRESYQKLYGYFKEHGIVATNLGREIYLKFNPENPEENVTELQAVLHKWDDRFAKNVERVLGAEARDNIMKDKTLFTLESSTDERATWIKAAMKQLDARADDYQKYDILSRCAHDFSQKRIAYLRSIYEQTGDVDEVLKAMYEDPAWYENPIRKGNIIYVKKVPYNQKGYQEAKTEAEKKRNYCHCPLVREYLDEIPFTFCYCGSGWYRQQWEGILQKPVKIEMVKSLLKGDDTCEFAIHLPKEVVTDG